MFNPWNIFHILTAANTANQWERVSDYLSQSECIAFHSREDTGKYLHGWGACQHSLSLISCRPSFCFDYIVYFVIDISSSVHLNVWIYCFVISPVSQFKIFCECIVLSSRSFHLNTCIVLFEMPSLFWINVLLFLPFFFENLGVYNKHFITRVPRLYGLYPLVKVFLSLSRSAPSFEKHLTREYNPYALGNRVIIYTYWIAIFYKLTNSSIISNIIGKTRISKYFQIS